MTTDEFTGHPGYAVLADTVHAALLRTRDENSSAAAEDLFALLDGREVSDWRRAAFALVRIVVPAQEMGLGATASRAYHGIVKSVSLSTGEQWMHLAIGGALHSGDTGMMCELRAARGDSLKDAVRLLFLAALEANQVPGDQIEALKGALIPRQPSPPTPALDFPVR